VPANLRITLIITTYNWPAALDLTLRSVVRQSVLPDEIIVADDGSGPRTRQVVTQWQERLRSPLFHVWQADEGFRLARSRNRAIAAARGDYLVIVDGDMVLHRHFIADHTRAARHGCFIQGVRLLTGPEAAARMLEEGQLDLGFFAGGIRRRRHAIRNRLLSTLVFKERTGQRAIRGCNQAYWKSDLIRVNGFNEAFVGWGREDNEIAARLYNAGVRRRNLKFQALAIHLHHQLRHAQLGERNDAMLRDTIEQRKAWCPLGLSQHLEPASHGVRQPDPLGSDVLQPVGEFA
jgi:glycosyltransferase involved in cell wall biosynthesis